MEVSAAEAALGKLAADMVEAVRKKGWPAVVEQIRGKSNILSRVRNIRHKASRVLQHLWHKGASARTTTTPWSKQQCDDAVHRGSHKSAHMDREFVFEEMADLMPWSRPTIRLAPSPFPILNWRPSLHTKTSSPARDQWRSTPCGSQRMTELPWPGPTKARPPLRWRVLISSDSIPCTNANIAMSLPIITSPAPPLSWPTMRAVCGISQIMTYSLISPFAILRLPLGQCGPWHLPPTPR